MNSSIKANLLLGNKMSLRLLLLLLFVMLAACSSSRKDYSDATPLQPIASTAKAVALWARSTGDVPEYAHAQLPVAIDGMEQLYSASHEGVIISYAVKDGEKRWRVDLDEALTGGPGIGESAIYVSTQEAELLALGKGSGAILWRQQMSSEMLASPAVAGGFIIVQTIDGKVSAFKEADGAQLWSHSRSIPKLTLRGTSAPLVVNDVVLAGFSDGRLVGLSLSTGELLWETTIAVAHGRTDLERLVDIDGLFVAVDGVVYVSSFQGRVVAVSIDSGSVLWARDMSSYTGLAVSGQHLYISDAESKVWALDGRTGATLWRQDQLKGREVSAPAVLGDSLVVADYDGFVHWLLRDDGGFMAREDLNKVWERLVHVFEEDALEEGVHRSVTVPPVVASDTLLIRDNTGALFAFRLAK